jgi:hypothetical protein
MTNFISVPIKEVHGEKWGQLNLFGVKHEICAESCKVKSEQFSFAGEHRTRLYALKSNVHWKIPEGVELDISAVRAEGAVRRRTQR